LNWEKEESDASPFQTINAVEEAVSEKVHGGARGHDEGTHRFAKKTVENEAGEARISPT